MKVIVSAQRAGWHKYPGHPTLGLLHRHQFRVWAIFNEQKSREVEFFEAQDNLRELLQKLPLEPGNDSPLSCEDIGKLVIRLLRCSSVLVSEDGENFVLVDQKDLSD